MKIKIVNIIIILTVANLSVIISERIIPTQLMIIIMIITNFILTS